MRKCYLYLLVFLGSLFRGFLKWWVSPRTMGCPTKNDHFGVFLGVPPFKETPILNLWEHREFRVNTLPSPLICLGYHIISARILRMRVVLNQKMFPSNSIYHDDIKDPSATSANFIICRESCSLDIVAAASRAVNSNFWNWIWSQDHRLVWSVWNHLKISSRSKERLINFSNGKFP